MCVSFSSFFSSTTFLCFSLFYAVCAMQTQKKKKHHNNKKQKSLKIECYKYQQKKIPQKIPTTANESRPNVLCTPPSSQTTTTTTTNRQSLSIFKQRTVHASTACHRRPPTAAPAAADDAHCLSCAPWRGFPHVGTDSDRC